MVSSRWRYFCATLAVFPAAVFGAGGSSYAGDSCNSGNLLATSGGTYTVTTCNARVLARCG